MFGTVLVICCFLTNYHSLGSLKHLRSCRGPEAQGLTGSSAQGCSQCISRMAFSSQGSTGEGSVHSLIQAVGRIYFPVDA